jgi:hypothetical protein
VASAPEPSERSRLDVRELKIELGLDVRQRIAATTPTAPAERSSKRWPRSLFRRRSDVDGGRPWRVRSLMLSSRWRSMDGSMPGSQS